VAGPDRGTVLAAWLKARWSMARLKRRALVAARQERLWRRMAPVIARTPAVSALAGEPLHRLPIVTPSQVREAFESWNTLGLVRAEAEAAAGRAENGGSGEVRSGVDAGFSSGSSGAPGLFVSSRAERAAYLGHLIARLLPASALLEGRRIALCLRAPASLYSDVAAAGPFRLMYMGLVVPGDERVERLKAFAPDVLIAPAHVLADIARRAAAGQAWRPTRLFWGAEPMGEAERAWIGQVLGARPDPIYQATEGFLGAPCRFGTLHLNEDVLVVEREPVPGTNRFVPIVTDLRRTSQPMIRVRLPDLLEATACTCGSPLAAVRPVEGRLEDLWRWGSAAITPREAEEAVSGALGPAEDWRAVASPAEVVVEAAPDQVGAAVGAIRELLARRGVGAAVRAGGLPPPIVVKRRRVRWTDG
jgi:putative adenylate-forming enzyme